MVIARAGRIRLRPADTNKGASCIIRLSNVKGLHVGSDTSRTHNFLRIWTVTRQVSPSVASLLYGQLACVHYFNSVLII